LSLDDRLMNLLVTDPYWNQVNKTALPVPNPT
jgi:hypothetical protein